MSNPVVVMGMHRSGTSFVVKALNLCGLWLGVEDSLFSVEGRAYAGNPKGNYESTRAIEINANILANSGGDWDHLPSTLATTAGDHAAIQGFLHGLEASKPDDSPRWGWKDPRTLLTFPAWAKALDGQATLVCVFRHPRLVAASLLARNRMPAPQSLALWHAYNSLMVKHMATCPSALLRFDVGKAELVDRLIAVCDQVGLRANRLPVEQWLDDGLVRSRTPPEDAVQLPPPVQSLWETLLRKYHDQPLNTVSR